jgi:hypothetical protein
MASIASRDRKNMAAALLEKHRIEFFSRFTWTSLPPGLTPDIIERVIYYRFRGYLFFEEPTGLYRFLPGALDGTPDLYGRPLAIKPMIFNGSSKEQLYLATLKLEVVYTKDEAVNLTDKESVTVPLVDCSYTIGNEPEVYPADQVKPLIEQLVDILVLLNIDLTSSAKIYIVKVLDQAQAMAVKQEFADMDRKIMNGERVFPITMPDAVDELMGTAAKDSARYMQSYQAIDNIRKDLIGVANGGAFLKQEHQTDGETMQNGNSASLVFSNALRMRKEFCEIANKVFGLKMAVEASSQNATAVVAPEGEGTNRNENKGDER